MNRNSEKDSIYLSALLHHIPHNYATETYKAIIANSLYPIESVLALADQYALTQFGKIAFSFSYVGSPFENLRRTKGEETSYDYKMPVLPLSLSREMFPNKDYELHTEKTGVLWGEFCTELAAILSPTKDYTNIQVEATLSLLMKYTTTLPNPSDINQEVSWYDYAKIKAGLAVCIYDYLRDEKKELVSKIQDKDKTLLIIRADLSGIQSFIYDIVSKQASKNLKGRSFYVQLLSDSVLIKMLEVLHLYQGNVMYASGGNFFVIAPNTEKVKTAFTNLEHQITKAIFDEHGTRISVVMGYQEVTQMEIFDGTINLAIKKLFEGKIDRNKKRKFPSLIEEDYKTFFEPFDVGGQEATDVITGEEILKNERNVYKIIESSSLPKKANQKDIDIGIDLIKEVTAKQIFLGHNLKDIKYLIATPEVLKLDLARAVELVVNPAELGINFYTVKGEREHIEAFEKALTGISNYKAYTINETKNGDFFLSKKSTTFPLMFYGGNKTPVVKDSIKNDRGEESYTNRPKYFDELAGEGEGRFKRLAVLKMDVDNLGTIFKDVNPSNLTFSYYSALSRHMDWFFKGYLNTLWENNEEFREYTQIIYSGGDDLFIVGRWDVIIAFAETIHREFAEFTCTEKLAQHGRVTISGGISIVTDKFPIIKAAAFADEAEKAAKVHKLIWTEEEKKKSAKSKYPEFRKNSINLFGKSLHWDTEYLLVKELKEDLVNHVAPNDNPKLGLPKSLLGKIQIYASMAEKYEQEKQLYEVAKKKNKNQTMKIEAPSPQWIWSVIYDFSRLADRVKGDNYNFIRKLQDKVDENIKSYLQGRLNVVDKIQRAIFTNRWDNETIESNYHFIHLLSLAARWAELEIRSKQK